MARIPKMNSTMPVQFNAPKQSAMPSRIKLKVSPPSTGMTNTAPLPDTGMSLPGPSAPNPIMGKGKNNGGF